MKKSDVPEMMTSMAMVAMAAATLKFLLEGVTTPTYTFGHTDPAAYGMFLTPILAAHGYIKVKKKKDKEEDEDKKLQ